jgi:dTDP-4-dehydrorhamnose 3,5-epimerase
MIEGVAIVELKTFRDERGLVREILRSSDPVTGGEFKQWNHSVIYQNVIKAWHYHRLQTDWWYVASGVLRVGLYDYRENSPTYREKMDFLIGETYPPVVVKIPPYVLHGCKAIQGPVHLFYLLSHEYDPADEYRLPYNDPAIGFDWLNGPAI